MLAYKAPRTRKSIVSKKPSPYEAFVDNIKDAEALMSYARAFENKRTRRMRQELRTKIGDALNVPVRQRDKLDRLESDDLFVVFKPNGSLGRGQFADLSPLLRQSIVAACAALETYVADKAMEFVGTALSADEIPSRMKNISLTIEDWTDIEEKYKRRRWGIRPIIEDHIRHTSSTAPSSIGIVFSTIGVKDCFNKIDGRRGVAKGTTNDELEAITERRNKIAHAADRDGRGRASITTDYVQQQIEVIKSVVDALDGMLKEHKV